MKRFLRSLALCVFLILSACQVGDYTVAKRSAIDKEIATARAETESHLKTLNDQQLSLLHQAIAAHEAREQGAADYLVKASLTFGTLKTPTRAEMVMGQSVQQTAAQLPPPSVAAQSKAMDALRVELDEARTTTEALRAQYEAELGKARAEGAAKDKALVDIAASLKHVDDEKVAVLTAAKDTEAQLSDKRKALSDAEIAAKTKEAEDAKATQAIKTKLSAIAGGLGLLFLLGAIYSPVFKDKLGLAAGVLLLAAVAIWYIQPWMVAVAVGLGVLALVGWAVKNHYVESKTAAGVYHAIQSVKDTAGADYDRLLKPRLEEWLTTYTKDGKSVPDKAALAHVDAVLMQTGAK